MSLSASALRNHISDIEKRLNQTVVGKSEQVHLAIIAMLAGGHLLFEDRPGVGKTTLAAALAAETKLRFTRIQFTSDLLPSDIVGYSLPNTAEPNTSTFHHGPIFTNILMADELNRASPRTQSALLEAMEEKSVTVDGITRSLPSHFMVIATQNGTETSGVSPLPESQLDRFMFCLSLGYPDPLTEKSILLERHAGAIASKKVSPPADADTSWLTEAVASIPVEVKVSDAVAGYLAALLAASRGRDDIQGGLSPRAGLSILKAAVVAAWLSGRNYVSPEDIRLVFVPSAVHRFGLGRGSSLGACHHIAEKLLGSVPLP